MNLVIRKALSNGTQVSFLPAWHDRHTHSAEEKKKSPCFSCSNPLVEQMAHVAHRVYMRVPRGVTHIHQKISEVANRQKWNQTLVHG